MPTPSFTPAYVLALITTVVSLLLTQGLIENGTAKLVTGLAAAFVPAILAAVHAITSARVHAAHVTASAVVPAKAVPVRKASTSTTAAKPAAK